MLRRKKEVKRILFTSIFILSILLTNSQFFSVSNADVMNQNESHFINNEKISSSSVPYLSDYYITGSGDNQDVRIYSTNSSSSLNNEGQFEIPSLSSTDTTYLSYGNFNFTFQNNYTTDYILEDTDALHPNDFIKFNYDEDISSININTGTNLDSLNLNWLVDGSSGTSIRFNSTAGGFLNFTIASDFTGTTYSRTGPTINLGFNRSQILGLIATCDLNINWDAYLTLKVFDMSLSSWVEISTVLVNSSFNPHLLEERFANMNLNYINMSDISQIQFYFDGVDNKMFTVTLKEYNLAATYAFDIPIRYNNYVALEFDLKGESSTINGFYAWIRTLNLTEAQNTELNVTLYKANSTIARTQANLASDILRPDTTLQIDSFIINYNDYHGDELTYFQFNPINTEQSPLYNYFIVIKSNRSQLTHSLVTIPRLTFGDPDSRLDHMLLTTDDNGLNWNRAKKYVTGTYFSEQLDVAAFKINVVRGYMPSDFNNPYDTTDNLEIQNLPIENQIISYGAYLTSSSLTWGRGTWNYNFTTPIESIPPNNFQIDLNWNNTVIKGFKFNVSYYAKAYWEILANSYYNVSYDTTPRWQLNFTLDLNNANFDNWDFLEFWYVFPNDYQPHNLTNPNLNDIFELVTNATGGEHQLPDDSTFGFINVSNEIVNSISGMYSLSLTSSNLIYDMHSYINYYDTLWETNGFMYGDNISIRVDIRDHDGSPAIGGNVNAKLFYPGNSTQYPGSELNSVIGVEKDGSLVFDFNNASILDVTEDVPLLGNYYLSFFWENGSAIGCKKLKLYIDTYDVQMNSFFYEPDLNQNILEGIVDKVFDNYSVLTATVNETSDIYDPNFYAVNDSIVDANYTYIINGEEIPISINTFMQNETFLNPQEDIIVKTTIQNHHDFVDLNVKLKVQLVSLVNDEWIIDEQVTPVQTINPGIDPNGDDIKEFTATLNMPTLQSNGIWQGVNAPVRKGGAKTRVIIYFEYGGESYEVGIYESNEYSLIINSTQSEFEASIIALKYDKKITGASLLKPFERDECRYLPDQTTLVVNIYDQNFVSSYDQFIESFSLNKNSQFNDININPNVPIYGHIFNITSNLASEFGDALPNENVSCLYFNGENWENVSSQISDSNGKVNFEINTLTLPSEEQYIFQLIWYGSVNILGNSQNVTVDLFRANNNITIDMRSNVDRIFKNQRASITITLTNIGDSELVITDTDINFLLQPTSQYTLGEINYIKLSQFRPDDEAVIIIEIQIPDIDQIQISVSIDATNPITDEDINFQSSTSFDIYDAPLDLYITAYFILIMIGIFIFVWAFMYIFVRRTIKRIEAPVEEPTRKRPRRGRYVTVSEIPKEIPLKEEEPSKKVKKKKKVKEEIEEEEEKKTDLDSLLEEEGL